MRWVVGLGLIQLATLSLLAWTVQAVLFQGRLAPLRAIRIPGLAGHRDEVGAALEAFRAVETRFEALADAQGRLLSDTAHELRSPLTALTADLDLLRQDPEEDLRFEVLSDCQQEVGRLSRLVSQLLLLGRFEAVLPESELQPVRLDILAAEPVERARRSHPGRIFNLVVSEEIEVRGDADQLWQILDDLISNAARYTQDGGEVRVEVWRRSRTGYLAVEDNGIGIPSQDLPRIFERFYRVDRGRARPTGGAGLGLAIVKALAEAQNGSIEVESANGGTRFTLALPLGDGP